MTIGNENSIFEFLRKMVNKITQHCRVKLYRGFRKKNFAFLRTWPFSYMSLEQGHVLWNAKFCIQRQIKNFTRNDFSNSLFLCTVTYLIGQLLFSLNFCRKVTLGKWFILIYSAIFDEKLKNLTLKWPAHKALSSGNMSIFLSAVEHW